MVVQVLGGGGRLWGTPSAQAPWHDGGSQAGEMAPWAKVLASKPDLIQSLEMTQWKKRTDLSKLSCYRHRNAVEHVHACTICPQAWCTHITNIIYTHCIYILYTYIHVYVYMACIYI